MKNNNSNNHRTAGFVSFRFAGTDGVSLETEKMADVLRRWGYRCVYMGGELDTPPEDSFLVEEAHFQHPDIREIYDQCFSQSSRPPEVTRRIHELRELFKRKLYEFIRMFDVDILIPENALTIPLNVPLGLAITEVIAETSMNTIAHHHDFFWERKRFLNNCVWDYLNSCYPPHLNTIQHVVINSSGQNQLALRTGIGATLIPNVMDFEHPPEPPDEYTRDVRRDLRIGENELLVLQPTRVVQRKGIEHAIELVARLGRKATLVISHASGDEGYEYQQRIREYAQMLEVDARFVQEIISDERGTTPDGRKIYSLQDIYPYADLVTYPSLSEGFGNAFLEAIYFKRPILVNNYSIYFFDIKPKGFDVIEMDDFITEDTVRITREVLDNPERIREMTEKNYALCLKHYSYRILEVKLRHILSSFWGQR
ncbi:MAG: glycosyltransferase family 4 protein [Spirochaetales bacterium]|nr:glycosyltransferase family 4 protein [Spirochaetales bacterium]